MDELSSSVYKKRRHNSLSQECKGADNRQSIMVHAAEQQEWLIQPICREKHFALLTDSATQISEFYRKPQGDTGSCLDHLAQLKTCKKNSWQFQQKSLGNPLVKGAPKDRFLFILMLLYKLSSRSCLLISPSTSHWLILNQGIYAVGASEHLSIISAQASQHFCSSGFKIIMYRKYLFIKCLCHSSDHCMTLGSLQNYKTTIILYKKLYLANITPIT